MGRTYEELHERPTRFLARQYVFFSATAASGDGGHVNLSPKGLDGTFAALGPALMASPASPVRWRRVARYLSQGWFDEVNEVARNSAALKATTQGVSLTLQQVVTAAPEGDLEYWLRIEHGSVRTGLGRAGGGTSPDAIVTQSYETAAAVVRGELSTEEAFLSGRIRLRGDIGVLLRHQSVLNDLGEVFGEVHRRTEYP